MGAFSPYALIPSLILWASMYFFGPGPVLLGSVLVVAGAVLALKLDAAIGRQPQTAPLIWVMLSGSLLFAILGLAWPLLPD